ncbi:helix-turn-helix domain-containing protein [Pseudomonas aeruginosa]|uniref:helix-turn-helix domain-containing protein n=1 Tax=Pseudomonas aeruginosa TaxID=287 RepID=UPI0015BCEEC0|nr:helix-turn-helix domain-containing protein [Pseudomonas aeruginosa]EKW5974328.1 helix-turn-helix domain-containing protein [Pseudomonas aeruginosa]EMB5660469.1 helix-turn-helix domain-containing protein [Pseudomonas aeruginosa]MBX6198401.1 helix-turn-helix domain-containing protein [Pseudomonas aeruginosa]MBX6760775.1 helix-turn-helix domain-containing protein [Pseudomonas aeruginosa]MBX6792727.1 helix-turn-helix domain-containing protein [Pseudomonas aeruginosa]
MNIASVPTDPVARWEWIKYQLRIRGTSIAEIARQLDITHRAVRIAKVSPYPRVERAISIALGLSLISLWPERWNDDGSPKRQRPNRSETLRDYDSYAKNSRYAPVSQRKSEARV